MFASAWTTGLFIVGMVGLAAAGIGMAVVSEGTRPPTPTPPTEKEPQP